MAHNPTGTRKSKSTRFEHPSKTHQVNDIEQPKEKVPRMTISREGHRRVKATSQQVLDTPSKIIVKDLHRLGVCQMVSVSKSQARATGGGTGAPGGQKYHRDPSLTPPSAKTTRSSVTTASGQKLTPKESLGFRTLTEHKDYKTLKEFKELKEPKPQKEPKEPQAKGAEKSPNVSHRHSRHQAERTKNYFDKYLKFAFDLSTPEGVKQLEAHFFPDQDPSGAGTSTNRQD